MQHHSETSTAKTNTQILHVGRLRLWSSIPGPCRQWSIIKKREKKQADVKISALQEFQASSDLGWLKHKEIDGLLFIYFAEVVSKMIIIHLLKDLLVFSLLHVFLIFPSKQWPDSSSFVFVYKHGWWRKKIISFHHQIQITRFHQNGWLRLCVLQEVGGGCCLDDGALAESFPQLMNLASISFKKKNVTKWRHFWKALSTFPTGEIMWKIIAWVELSWVWWK